MAESTSNVRLVRCPKCENLLPELPDYSVYQCGGCGAVLRAKKSELDGDTGSAERPIDAIPGVLSEKSDNFPANPDKFPAKSASTVESGEGTVSDSDRSTGAIAESCDTTSKETIEKCGFLENGIKMCRNPQLENGSLKSNDTSRLKSHVEAVDGSLSTNKKSIRQKTKERGEKYGVERLHRGEYEYQGVRFHPPNPAGEGTSRYYTSGDHRSAKNPTESRGGPKPNREELLRKLDELKEQLNQSCDVNSKSKEKEPLEPLRMFHAQDPYVDPDGRFHDHPSGYHRMSRQFCDLNEGVSRPSRYYDHQFSAVDRYGGNYGLLAQDLSHGTSEYENSSAPRLSCRPIPRRVLGYPPQNPRPHPFFTGQYRNPEHDLFEPDPLLDSNFPCSCYQCYHKQIQIPPPAYRRYHPLGASKPLPSQHQNYRVFPPHGGGGGYDTRFSHSRPYIGSYESHPPSNNTRWPSDLNLELSEIPHPARMALVRKGRPIRPIAGGAPFVTCHNCSELLELPKKMSSHPDKTNQWKICCGSCSSLISFMMVDEKLVPVDVVPQKKALMKEVLDSSGEHVMHDKPYDPHSGMRMDNAGFHSEEFDNNSPTYNDFQSMDNKEHLLVSSCAVQCGSNLSKSEELTTPQLLSSSTTSEDEDIHGNLAVQKNVADEFPTDSVLSMPSPSSPLQEHFDFSSRGRRAVNRCGKGSLSSRSDQERVVVVSGKTAMRQNSLQESLATEMEISLNDYANAAAENFDMIKEEDHQPKGKRGGVDSFLAGIIKKSFRNNESRKRTIMVNGHVIQEKSLKKAEKLAGPVSPGQYWYDQRAGFWGLMGGPCLGIIPPHIEEFSYLIPEKCAAGDTTVFVNGRELHQKDLELLASRGLPTTRHRSYIIEISGRVLDEDSGEELDGLGKLAPTIEKVKHGFGMRDPSASAQCA